MAGWSVLEALTGFREDAHTGSLELRHPGVDGSLPFLASTGWGLLVVEGDDVRLECTGGHLNVSSFTLHDTPGEPDGALVCRFPQAMTIAAGESVSMRPVGRELDEAGRRPSEVAW